MGLSTHHVALLPSLGYSPLVTLDQQAVTHSAGRIRRSPSEIIRILGVLAARQGSITAHLHGGELPFISRLRFIDPSGHYIIVEPSSNEAANVALLSQPQCALFASISGWHVEFVAADPREIMHGGTRAIRFRFPEVLVDLQRRPHERASVSQRIPLRCVADAGGVLSFKGGLVDICVSGIGFLVYDPDITLEPGTVLKGCRIEPDDMLPLILDLEVRYSELVSLADGTRAKRSGCRIIDPPEALKHFVEVLLSHRGQGTEK